MTKNEIVARWNGFDKPHLIADWNFDDYNYLHKTWVKFRDLKFDDRQLQRTHTKMVTNLGNHIAWSSITEALKQTKS